MTHSHSRNGWKQKLITTMTDWAFWAFVVAALTLAYMYRHDAKTDWSEVHKSMISVLAAQKSALAEKGQMGAGSSATQNAFVVRQIEYDAAVTQLRGQLSRIDDGLVVKIVATLDQNKDPTQWLSDEFVKTFTALADDVAAKAR